MVSTLQLTVISPTISRLIFTQLQYNFLACFRLTSATCSLSETEGQRGHFHNSELRAMCFNFSEFSKTSTYCRIKQSSRLSTTITPSWNSKYRSLEYHGTLNDLTTLCLVLKAVVTLTSKSESCNTYHH